MAPRDDAHERLDAVMDARRRDLGMTWAEVAREARITVETLRALRRGNNAPSALTSRGLDRALKWHPGSVEAILSGADPRATDTSVADSEDDLLTADERRMLEEIRRDPAKRRRLLNAILAGHGHDVPSTDHGDDESAGHRAS